MIEKEKEFEKQTLTHNVDIFYKVFHSLTLFAFALNFIVVVVVVLFLSFLLFFVFFFFLV